MQLVDVTVTGDGQEVAYFGDVADLQRDGMLLIMKYEDGAVDMYSIPASVTVSIRAASA